MKTVYGSDEAKKRFRIYIPIPNFLSHQWVLEQEQRVQAVARQVLAKHDAENKSMLRAYRLERGEESIVVEAWNLDVLEIVRGMLAQQGVYIEAGLQAEDQ